MPVVDLPDLSALFRESLQTERRRPKTGESILTWSDLRIWTRDDPPQFVSFEHNPIQATLEQDLTRVHPECRHLWQVKGLRVNILKSRQQGLSTFWLALWYQMFYNLPYTQTVIITHRADSTSRLWERVELWEQEIRKRRQLPDLRYSNRRELVRRDTGASLFIGTAGQDDITRSGIITNLHRTESAFWVSDDVITGALGTIPAWANIVEESTANGYGPHKDRFDRMADKPGAYFFPFSDSPEYRIAVPIGFTRTREEADLRAERIIDGQKTIEPVPDEAIYWRRLKNEDFVREGKPEKTTQEFPLTPREAFSGSAQDAYYPSDYIEALLEEFRDLVPIEVIAPPENGFGGRIEIYEYAQDGVTYTIGADEAEGFDADNDHDDSAADGFRDDTGDQVFSYHGRPDPEHFAYDLDALSALAYNNAMIVCERPPLGGSTCPKLRDINANVYKHERGQENAPDHVKYGFPARAKDLRDGALKAALVKAAHVWRKFRDTPDAMLPSEAARYVGCPVIKSKITLNQLLRYAELKNGKRGGKGSHDDHNTSVTVACWYMENFVPRWATAEPLPDDGNGLVYAPRWSDRG